MGMDDDDFLDTLLGGDEKTEMERVLFLPIDQRQPEDYDEDNKLVERFTEALGRGDSDRKLLPAQALCLDVFSSEGGLLANVGVGHGKTLIGLLAPTIFQLDSYEALYLHPAGTRQSLHNEVVEQHPHFKIETQIHAMSYTELSQQDGMEKLQDCDPQLIIADEAHNLRRTNSARTKRLKRWFSANPETLFIGMSGTLTSDSISEFAHLSEWALRSGSPVPRSWMAQDNWKRTLDVDDYTKVPRQYHWEQMQPLMDAFGTGEELMELNYEERKTELRTAFMERFSSAPGVVRTSRASVGASIRGRPIERGDFDSGVPECVAEALQRVKDRLLLPCETELDDPLAKGRALRQLSLGFYYRWDWPNDEVDREWLYARREWREQVRRIVRYGPSDLDTPGLVQNAVQRGEYDHDDEIMEAWNEWDDHRHKDPPPKETIWLDDYVVQDVLERVERVTDNGHAPIVWYHWRAVAERLDELGLDIYWPGGGRDPEQASGDAPIGLAIKSAKEGNNLQQFDNNILPTPPSNGLLWEQLLGRTHRQGQEADTVQFSAYVQTDKLRQSVRDAIVDAQYVERTQDQRQKLLLTDWEKPI